VDFYPALRERSNGCDTGNRVTENHRRNGGRVGVSST
jgi:hypothetical protein